MAATQQPEAPPAETVREGYSRRRIAVSVAVALGVVIGAWAIGNALGTIAVPVALAIFALIATVPKLARWTLLLACATLVATLVLIGFNVVLGKVELPDLIADSRGRLGIKAGLGVALVVFGSAAYFYLRGTWLRAVPTNWRPRRPFRWLQIPTPNWPWWVALLLALALSSAVILGLPRLLSKVEDQLEDPPAAVPVRARLGVDIDVLLVADRRYAEAAELPATRVRGGFVQSYSQAVDLHVSYGVGLAEGTTLVWTRTGIPDAAQATVAMTAARRPRVPDPERRAGAGSAIVLIVDGTPPVVEEPEALEDVAGRQGEVERWRAIALAARTAGWETTPVYALLQTTDEDRLAEWAGAFDDLGGVVSVQQQGSQAVTDAAVRLAVGNSEEQQNFWLAMQHRPILLFDREESVPRPLSIEWLFNEELVRQCSDLESRGTCGRGTAVTDPAALRSPGRHLVITRPKKNLRDLALEEQEAWEQGAITLAAPAPTGDAALSAASDPGAPPAGTPPATVQDPAQPAVSKEELLGFGSRIYVHPVLVEQDERKLLHLDYWWYLHDNPAAAVQGAFCGAGMVILGVTCFDHESDWEGLTVVLEQTGEEWEPQAVYYAQHESVVRYEWQDLRDHWDGEGGLTDEVRQRLPDYADRPIAFIASGTHASYANRCDDGCRQVAKKDLEENAHDGRRLWVGDDTVACLRVACLIPLPTAAGGGGPAYWNAFDGPWGSRRCVWTYYCDSGTPPAAPGQQDRYKDPKRFDGRAKVGVRDSYEPDEG